MGTPKQGGGFYRPAPKGIDPFDRHIAAQQRVLANLDRMPCVGAAKVIHDALQMEVDRLFALPASAHAAGYPVGERD